MSERIHDLLSMTPAAWTPDLEAELEKLILIAVKDGAVLKVTVRADSVDQVAHYTRVSLRIREKHHEEILSEGRVYLQKDQTVQWTWSGYTEKVKQAIHEARLIAKARQELKDGRQPSEGGTFPGEAV